jgi:Flp pilus assembly protein TadD
MPLDPYSACPGGSGKKLKFCCSDLMAELEQIDRLVEGDQLAAAREQVRSLDAAHPGRACLLAARARLDLAGRDFAGAASASRAYLEAFPDNPLALGYAAITAAIGGSTQEAATLFDRAREATGKEVPTDLIRIAATLVQAAAQSGHPGFAQGIVDWMEDSQLGSAEDRRMLAVVVGSSGVPPALRARMPLVETPSDSPWRFEFDSAVKAAKAWRLTKALTTFRSLRGVASTDPGVFTNIAVLCEALARPFEAAEAWLEVARLSAADEDAAIEATGRAMALETEANPERSPVVRLERWTAPLPPESAADMDLLEDRIRHDGHCEPASVDRSEWVSRGAVPPRSVWRVFDAPAGAGTPSRLLATLLLFGRQTDREAEAVLQGFAPDLAEAAGAVHAVLPCTFTPPAPGGQPLPAVSPTNWLVASQYRMAPPTAVPASTPAGAPTVFEALVAEQRDTAWRRFVSLWPDTALPELLGRTPREALADADGRRRVAALIGEGEATARRPDAATAWAQVRTALGLPTPGPIDADGSFATVPPLRWHRLRFDTLPLDDLRVLFLTAVDAGFETAADRAATALVARPDAGPEDRWEALGVLEERAGSTVRRLEIIGELRGLARQLQTGDGMLDVAELRIRIERGDQTEVVRLLDHIRREHAGDQRVFGALAEVLMEAGVDIPGMAAGRPPAGARRPDAPAAAAAPQAAPAAGIWTPGQQAGPPGEKKTIWTPG